MADPTLCRPVPILRPRHERVALADRAHAQPEESGLGVGRRRIDWCSAFRAEGLDAPVAARGRLHVGLGNTGEKPETAFNRRDDNPEGRAGKRLTIGAMTNLDRIRIDVGFIGQITAMAAPINFHGEKHSVTAIDLKCFAAPC